MVEVVLGVAALLIGLTGAWSPCGFSMVETIGPAGHTGGRRVTAAALATFIPGALAGGVLTFVTLSLLGEAVHGAGGRLAYGIAAAIALAAALAEARGVPIVPQIRRQLPEHWRRVMPMPLAAGLYGVLLGLGFTTFVLSFGVWALAGISLAVGDPSAGLIVGLAFGAGRAIPVLVLAPICRRPSGIRATELMTQRPSLYRGARRGDAVALAASAVALTISPAGAATTVERGAADPTKSGGDLVFEKAGGAAVLERADGTRVGLPGTDPAIGGPYIVVRERTSAVLLDRRTLEEVAHVAAPGATAFAVSKGWLAYRSQDDGSQALRVRRVDKAATGAASPASPAATTAKDTPRILLGNADVVARVDSPGVVDRPALAGSTLVYARASTVSNTIRELDLATGRRRTLVASRFNLYSAPSVAGGSFSYLRTTNERQEVRVRKLGARGLGALVYSTPSTSHRDPDHGKGHSRPPTRIPVPDLRRTDAAITSTTLTKKRVYLTLLVQRGGRVRARIAKVRR